MGLSAGNLLSRLPQAPLVVDGCGEMKSLAHDRDDLAIAGVARASDRVPLDDGLSLGHNGGRSEYEQGKRTSLSSWDDLKTAVVIGRAGL